MRRWSSVLPVSLTVARHSASRGSSTPSKKKPQRVSKQEVRKESIPPSFFVPGFASTTAAPTATTPQSTPSAPFPRSTSQNSRGAPAAAVPQRESSEPSGPDRSMEVDSNTMIFTLLQSTAAGSSPAALRPLLMTLQQLKLFSSSAALGHEGELLTAATALHLSKVQSCAESILQHLSSTSEVNQDAAARRILQTVASSSKTLPVAASPMAPSTPACQMGVWVTLLLASASARHQTTHQLCRHACGVLFKEALHHMVELASSTLRSSVPWGTCLAETVFSPLLLHDTDTYLAGDLNAAHGLSFPPRSTVDPEMFEAMLQAMPTFVDSFHKFFAAAQASAGSSPIEWLAWMDSALPLFRAYMPACRMLEAKETQERVRGQLRTLIHVLEPLVCHLTLIDSQSIMEVMCEEEATASLRRLDEDDAARRGHHEGHGDEDTDRNRSTEYSSSATTSAARRKALQLMTGHGNASVTEIRSDADAAPLPSSHRARAKRSLFGSSQPHTTEENASGSSGSATSPTESASSSRRAMDAMVADTVRASRFGVSAVSPPSSAVPAATSPASSRFTRRGALTPVETPSSSSMRCSPLAHMVFRGSQSFHDELVTILRGARLGRFDRVLLSLYDPGAITLLMCRVANEWWHALDDLVAQRSHKALTADSTDDTMRRIGVLRHVATVMERMACAMVQVFADAAVSAVTSTSTIPATTATSGVPDASQPDKPQRHRPSSPPPMSSHTRYYLNIVADGLYALNRGSGVHSDSPYSPHASVFEETGQYVLSLATEAGRRQLTTSAELEQMMDVVCRYGIRRVNEHQRSFRDWRPTLLQAPKTIEMLKHHGELLGLVSGSEEADRTAKSTYPVWLTAGYVAHVANFVSHLASLAGPLQHLRNDFHMACRELLVPLLRHLVSQIAAPLQGTTEERDKDISLQLLAQICKKEVFDALQRLVLPLRLSMAKKQDLHRAGSVWSDAAVDHGRELLQLIDQLIAISMNAWVPMVTLALHHDMHSARRAFHDWCRTSPDGSNHSWNILWQDAHAGRCLMVAETLVSMRVPMVPGRGVPPIEQPTSTHEHHPWLLPSASWPKAALLLARHFCAVLSAASSPPESTADRNELGAALEEAREAVESSLQSPELLKSKASLHHQYGVLDGAFTHLGTRGSFGIRCKELVAVHVSRRRCRTIAFLQMNEDPTMACAVQSGLSAHGETILEPPRLPSPDAPPTNESATTPSSTHFTGGGDSAEGLGHDAAVHSLLFLRGGSTAVDVSRVAAAQPLFPSELRDVSTVLEVCHAVEQLWSLASTQPNQATSTAKLRYSSTMTVRIDHDLQCCFKLLSAGGSMAKPWELLSCTFALDRRLRGKLPALSQPLQRLRTRTFLQLFASASPRHISAITGSHSLTEIIAEVDDLVCAATPVTLLGLKRDAARWSNTTEMHSPRLLRAHFFAVKQIVNQVVSLEADLEAMFATNASEAAVAVRPTTPQRDENENENEGGSNSRSSGDVVPQTVMDQNVIEAFDRHRQRRHQNRLVGYVTVYLQSLVVAVDLIVDSLRSHAFQKTLEESLRLLLNHGLVRCCQLLHRALKRHDGGGLSMRDGSNGLMTVACVTVSSYFSTLLSSDARHDFLQDVTRRVVHNLLVDMHAFVQLALRTYPTDATPFSFLELLIEFTDSTRSSVAQKFGLEPRSRRSTLADHGPIKWHGKLVSILDALIAMQLTSSLSRQSPLPSLTVHALVQRIQRELITDSLYQRIAETDAKAPLLSQEVAVLKASVKTFEHELKALEARLASDLRSARTELDLLRKKTEQSHNHLPEVNTNAFSSTISSASEPTVTVEETIRAEDTRVASSEQRIPIVADSKYLRAKVRTLEQLAAVTFSQGAEWLEKLDATLRLIVPRRTGEHFHTPEVGAELDVAADEFDVASSEGAASPSSRSEADEPFALGCSGDGLSMQESLSRFEKLYQASHARFRATTLYSRRTALVEELVSELLGMVRQHRFVPLCLESPNQMVVFLRTLRLGKRLPGNDVLCAEIATQLQQVVNDDVAKRRREQLAHRNVSIHASKMKAHKEDPSAFAASVTSGGLFGLHAAAGERGRSDGTRYQSVENLSVLEALASRSEPVPELVMRQSGDVSFSFPVSASLGDDIGTPIPVVLPVAVLAVLLEDLKRLEATPGVIALVKQVSQHVVDRFVLPVERLGPRSTIYEVAGPLLPLWVSHAEGASLMTTMSVGDVPTIAAVRTAAQRGDRARVKQLVEVRIAQNMIVIISVLSRALLACTRHRLGMEDTADHHVEVVREIRRGMRSKRSTLDTRKVLARHRFARLQNPRVLTNNWCEMLIVGVQQAIVKLFLFCDQITFDAGLDSQGDAPRQHAHELRFIAARALHEASRHLAADLVPTMVRRALVPVIAVFLCVPTAPALSAGATLERIESAEMAYKVQCPTLFGALTIPYLTEFIPRLAEGGDLNFSASVGSVLDCRLRETPANGLSGIVRCACVLTNLIPKRSQLHIHFLHELGSFVVDFGKWHRRDHHQHDGAATPSSTSPSDALHTSDPLYLQDEDLILLMVTLLRKDVNIPEEKLTKLLCRCFQLRRDLFGEAPTSSISIAGLSAGGFGTQSGFQLHQLNLNSSAVREARHADEAREADDALRRIGSARAALPDVDAGAAEVDDAAAELVAISTSTDEAGDGDVHAASTLSAFDTSLSDTEATRTFEAFSAHGEVPMTSHRAAIQSLSFTAEQLLVLMLAYSARTRLRKDVRMEAIGLLRSAAIDRRERIANRLSRSSTPLTWKEREELFALRLSNHLLADEHFGIGVLHAHFAFRKIIHAAARKTGVVQAPHTLADIVEMLHEIEESWRDKGRCDGTLNATLKVLTEWAVLRVEDAGCDGTEDRNQFVTPVSRLFGDMALKIIKHSREIREFHAAQITQGGRKWRIQGPPPQKGL